MEKENPEIQKQWKRERLILGIATLIIPITFILRLPFGNEYPPVPVAFVFADTLYFSVVAFDMGRLKINIIFRALIILLFFPIFKFFVFLVYCQACYQSYCYIFWRDNTVHMLYFLLPPILYFLITAGSLKLFIRLRREKEGGAFNLLNSILIFLVFSLLFCLIITAICLA